MKRDEQGFRERLAGMGGGLIIGEVGQAHDGSLGMAHAYIEAIARTGAEAVKFQTHLAAAESTLDEPWRVRFSRQDATRYDYWRRMEFTPGQWRGLAEHARECGLWFLSSPFSVEAVELLEEVGVPAWKVGAGEVGNLPLLEAMAATGRPVLLSSGMAGWAELDRAVEVVGRGGGMVAILQCTTAYPCPPERYGLNVLDELRRRYGCPVGLSDHSGRIYAGLAAATLGARIIEVHVTFSRECFGPDTSSSLTTDELRQLVEGVRTIETALANPVDKDRMAEELGELRRTFGKSIVAGGDLPAGHQLRRTDLGFKKPGTGIPAARYGELLGRRLRRGLRRDEQIGEADFE
jgi:N,N'-diacetyllegionaminate synthase